MGLEITIGWLTLYMFGSLVFLLLMGLPLAFVTGGLGVVYLTLINESKVSDRLMSVKSAVAEKAEIHEVRMSAGRAKMQEVKDGLEILANERIQFRSGGYHIMLMRLKRNLEVGDKFEVVLEFEKSGVMTVESEVRQL